MTTTPSKLCPTFAFAFALTGWSLALAACDSGTEEEPCGAVMAHVLTWQIPRLDIAANARGAATFVLEPIGPAPVCARRILEVYVCGRPREDVVPPSGQPTGSCVSVAETCSVPSACGPYSMEIQTTTPGTYELWLAASETVSEWGRPQGSPLQIVVRE